MNRYFYIVFLFLSLFLIIFSFFPINLPTADLGRHITNGEIFLNAEKYQTTTKDLLHTNLFSYTHPNFNFINHHWFSGIIMYLIFNLFGFSGLSMFYFLLILTTLLVLLTITKKDNLDLSTTALLGMFLIPLIASRNEVRPEGISFLFIALFLYILNQYLNQNETEFKINKKLWLIPILELFWVNIHIYFIFGPFIIGAFLLEAIIKKNVNKIKNIFYILCGISFATILNPYGIKGVLYPFFIFQNYGYRIVENQSINFLEKLSFVNPDFLWYKITLLLTLVTSVILFIKKRDAFKWSLTIISLTFAVLGYLSIRNITLFAIVSLPLLAHNITQIKNIFNHKIEKIDKDNVKIFYGILFSVVLICTIVHFNTRTIWNRDFKIGINKETLAPIDFIKNNHIVGPFFNNYDIGSFMIFGLFPKERVFVDNRPEAYLKEFFEKIYIPMQENETAWQTELNKYNFNAIFFYRLDYTPWAQKFLIDKIKDPLWAPVFVDKETIIFLYRNDKNSQTIKKYELPKNMFNVQ